MITIKQTQKKIPFSTDTYCKKAQTILTFLGYEGFDLGIWLTTDQTIKKYNLLYRNKNKATDVLSFPFHPDLQAGERIVPRTNEDKNIGDIIISVEYVYANKHHLNSDFEARMDRMLVHGICHLLGYDHIEDKDYKIMFALEQKFLKLINSL